MVPVSPSPIELRRLPCDHLRDPEACIHETVSSPYGVYWQDSIHLPL